MKRLFVTFLCAMGLTMMFPPQTAGADVFIVTAGPQTYIEPEVEELMPREDIELIALVTMAEAEAEPELGKRLVIDTILNRVDSPRFPDTVDGVIYAPRQFSSMWNGRVDRCYVREDICVLVEEELRERTNSDCVFFRAGHYGDGTPMFQVGNHYFSSL